MRKERPGDYVFRYRLKRERETVCPDRLLEMVRAQVGNILDLVILTQEGKEVRPDGFKLLRDRATIHQIFFSPSWRQGEGEDQDDPRATSEGGAVFQDRRNAALYEPQIELVGKQLQSLLSVVDLEQEGEVVKADAFRLRDLRDWLVPSSGSPEEVFGYAASRCDCDCVFCYHKGNPPSLALGNLRRTRQEELEEIRTRLKYFSPESRQALFPSLGCLWEVFAHPRSLEILQKLRQKTSRTFRIATSGSCLTPQFVARLAELKPLYLYLSLNSSSPARRCRLMRDKHPQVAIQSLPLLQERGIPYATVIVPWRLDSLEELQEDLAATVAYADKHQAHLIEINLPGYSRYYSPRRRKASRLGDTEEVDHWWGKDWEEVWRTVVSLVRELRGKTACPIVAMPTMYEENLYELCKNLPRVIGLVCHSPAAEAGVRKGDMVLAINGLPVDTRPQARDLLSLLGQSDHKEACLKVKREGQSLELTLDLEHFSYPYSQEWDHHLGIIFLGTGARLSYLERLKETICSHQVQRVLFLSSALVKPTIKQCLAESPLLGNTDVDVQVPVNRFFGGNIFMGDLLVVQDFIDYIKGYLASGKEKPDLIVIPSSPFNLGGWGRDLTGRVYLDIEREVGIPVELLECGTIYD